MSLRTQLEEIKHEPKNRKRQKGMTQVHLVDLTLLLHFI